MTVAVVGDVKAAEVFPLVETYFGRLPQAPRPLPLRTVEPPQKAERQVVIHDAAQPFYVEGYHRPGFDDPDDAVYDVIQDLMSSGRTSRLYRSLVRDKKIAAAAAGFGGFPGVKYPGLFAFFGVPDARPRARGDPGGDPGRDREAQDRGRLRRTSSRRSRPARGPT